MTKKKSKVGRPVGAKNKKNKIVNLEEAQRTENIEDMSMILDKAYKQGFSDGQSELKDRLYDVVL